MNIRKKILVIALLVVSAGEACATENNSEKHVYLTPIQSAQKVAESYKNTQRSEYENLDEYYAAMQHYGFPNLSLNPHYSAARHLDFSDPKSLQIYQEIRSSINETQHIKGITDFWGQSLSEAELEEREKIEERKFRESENFKKETYYNFFKNQLLNSDITSVEICFDVDVIGMGLFGYESGLIPIRQINSRIREQISTLVLELGFKEEVVKTLQTEGLMIICHALITVGEDELDLLYASDTVSSFMNPERAAPNRF